MLHRIRSLQAKGIKISICKATSSNEDIGRKEIRVMTFISISSPHRVARRKNPVAPLFPSFRLLRNYSRIVPLVPGNESVLLSPPYLSKSGCFSTRGCSTRDTVSISSIYRLVPFNKPKFRRGDSREFSNAPFRFFVYTRGGIESDLVVKKDLTSRGNLRVTIITSKCGGTPKKRFYHAWIYKGEKIIVSYVS